MRHCFVFRANGDKAQPIFVLPENLGRTALLPTFKDVLGRGEYPLFALPV